MHLTNDPGRLGSESRSPGHGHTADSAPLPAATIPQPRGRLDVVQAEIQDYLLPRHEKAAGRVQCGILVTHQFP